MPCVAVDLNMQRCSPGLLIALDDPLISHSIVKLCTECYLGPRWGKEAASNPLISPIRAGDDVITVCELT
jgi:hypothetical protein